MLDDRVEHIFEVITDLAHGNLEARATPAGTGDEVDAIMVGLNMLAEEFSTAYADLEQLNYRDELILNSVGEGILGVDLDGRVTYANTPAARLTGHEPGELLGLVKHDCIHHSKCDGSPYPPEECPLVATIDHGRPCRVTDEVFWRKDGTSFPVDYSAWPLRENGSTSGAVIVFEDVSERYSIEKLKRDFVSVVSHELRTPLTSMRGSLGLLAGGAVDPSSEQGRRLTEIAVSNAERLVRLINDVLDLERMSSGRLPLRPEACSAADLISQAADEMSAMAEEAGVHLLAAPFDATLWADSDRIVQVLTNLLSNAIKFSPRGGTVSITARRDGDEVLFEVTDQGPGIPEDSVDVIFSPFEQVDSSDTRAKGGTGLGLAICRSVVVEHGGRIWVDPAPGGGSTFSFTVPVAAEYEHSEEAGPPVPAGEKS